MPHCSTKPEGKRQANLQRYVLPSVGLLPARSKVPPERVNVMHLNNVPGPDDLLHRQVQNWWRTDALGTIYDDKPLPVRSHIVSLSPWLDENGMLHWSNYNANLILDSANVDK